MVFFGLQMVGFDFYLQKLPINGSCKKKTKNNFVLNFVQEHCSQEHRDENGRGEDEDGEDGCDA